MIVINPALRPYFEARAGAVPAQAQFFGRWHDGELIGVVGVWNYSGIDAEVGWAGEPGRWLTKSFLQIVFAYLFGQLNLRRITGRIASDNAEAIEASTRLGFAFEGKLRSASPSGADVFIVGMLKEECRYGKFK